MKAINMKKMEIVTLFNSTMNDKDEYRLMNIGYADLKASKEVGGSEELKALIRERIEELFNGDILEYFDSVDVTDEDVDYCIKELAIGHASNIAGEDFYWGDAEELISDIHKDMHIHRCKECGSTDIEQKYWVNPNTMEVGEWCEEDDCWCNDCEDYSRVYFQKTEDYEQEVADYTEDIRKTIERDPNAAYLMRSDTDEDMEVMVTRFENSTDKLRVMFIQGDQIVQEYNDVTLADAVHHVMRFQHLYNGKVKGNCECK